MKKAASALMTLVLTLLFAVPSGARAQNSEIMCFPETGQCIAHGFKNFWMMNGGLPVFGYPLTGEITERNPDTGQSHTVQYFERQRFEYHPNNPEPYKVLLGHLGVADAERRGLQGSPHFTPRAGNENSPNCTFFRETGHQACGLFRSYWSSHGLDLGEPGMSFRESLALFGFPVSAEFTDPETGLMTQYFERARFEHHPNNPKPFKVLLGRLGPQVLERTQGFQTKVQAMLRPTGNGSVKPIISTGDRLSNGYEFESIPDGIGIVPRGNGVVDVFVAHETTTVPFAGAADYKNAEISKLRVSQASAGVLGGEMVWTSDLNFARFCSAFMASEREGFKQPVFFTGEEDNAILSLPPAPAWPPQGNLRQAGFVVAVEANTGKKHVIQGMGRMNHENTVIVPGGWNQVVAVTDDDTFDAPSAQVYMYLANSPDDLLADKGELYAFVSDTPTINDYGDLTTGMAVGGRFIPVPREIAMANQDVLEQWSNANNVFQFIRAEDMAYDQNNPRVLYIADTGEPRAVPDASTGRLRRGERGTRGPYPNGRVFKMTLNDNDPRQVDRLEILIDADVGGYNNPNVLHNPDNMDTSANSLMIQEDPISENNFDPGKGPNARIWRYDLRTGSLNVVAEVDQSLDLKAKAGSWESSGIVDASEVFGPGTWIADVQAHSIRLQQEPAGDYTRKREGGQLLLLTVPGS